MQCNNLNICALVKFHQFAVMWMY